VKERERKKREQKEIEKKREGETPRKREIHRDKNRCIDTYIIKIERGIYKNMYVHTYLYIISIVKGEKNRQ
jgi:hypothetical protein